MNNKILQLGITLFAVAALLAGCTMGIDGTGVETSAGNVTITIGTPARTLVPSLPINDSSVRYHIKATDKAESNKKANADADIAATSVTIGLQDAAWTITVSAYTGVWGGTGENVPVILAQGTADVTVEEGVANPAALNINLEQVPVSGNGTLSLTVGGTDYAVGSAITITKDDGAPLSGTLSTTGATGAALTFTNGAAPLTEDIAGHILTLPNGRYIVDIILKKAGGLQASYREIAEVWTSLTTAVDFTAEEDHYLDPNAIVAKYNLIYYSSLQNALTAAGSGETDKTVSLIRDITITGANTIPNEVTLATGSHKVSLGAIAELSGSFKNTGSAALSLSSTGIQGGILQPASGAIITIKEDATFINTIVDLCNGTLKIDAGKVLTIVASSGLAGLATTESTSGTGILVGTGNTTAAVSGLDAITGTAGNASVTITGNSETAGDGISSSTITGTGGKKFVVDNGTVISAPPTITVFSPAGPTGVSITVGSLEIIFSESIKLGSGAGDELGATPTWDALKAAGFSFGTTSGTEASTSLVTSAVYSAANHKLTLTVNTLANNTDYYLTIAGIHDLAGNPLGTVVKTFKTIAEDQPSVTVGTQTGAVFYGTGGTATYSVGTANITTPAYSNVTWYSTDTSTDGSDTAPAGITPSYDSSTLTLTVGASVNAGEYYFTVSMTGTHSEVPAPYVSARKSLTVERQPITSAAIDLAAPVANTALPSTFTPVTHTTTGSITWKLSGEPVTSSAGYNKVYTADIVINADGNHNFTGLTVDNITAAAAVSKSIVLSNNNETVTVTLTFPATERQPLVMETPVLSDAGVVSWTAVTGADSYTVKVYKSSDNLPVGDEITNAASGTASIFGTLQTASAATGGYYVKVIAEGSGDYTDSPESAASNAMQYYKDIYVIGDDFGVGGWVTTPVANSGVVLTQTSFGVFTLTHTMTATTNTFKFHDDTITNGYNNGNWFVVKTGNNIPAVGIIDIQKLLNSGGTNNAWLTSAIGNWTITLKLTDNTVTFTQNTVVESVTINPDTATLYTNGNKIQQFTATVAGSGPNDDWKGITWEIAGKTSENTVLSTPTVTGNGSIVTLTIGSDETAGSSITVTATSSANGFISMTASAAVTVTQSGNADITVYIENEDDNITLSGAVPTIHKTGSTDTSFTLSVTNPNYTYIWYVDDDLKPATSFNLETGNSTLVLPAADYKLGGHTVLLVAKTTADVSWSKTIDFTVVK
jgi:hypothetical protein